MSELLTRRAVLLCAAAALIAPALPAFAAPPLVSVWKDPNCGCCGAWVTHLTASGYATAVEEIADMSAVKARYQVPQALASCHTARVGAYVLEGHVPASAISRLLAEQPRAIGLAVPGMPSGSPGMDGPGAPQEEYDVVLFGEGGAQRSFMRFRGGTAL